MLTRLTKFMLVMAVLMALALALVLTILLYPVGAPRPGSLAPPSGGEYTVSLLEHLFCASEGWGESSPLRTELSQVKAGPASGSGWVAALDPGSASDRAPS